MLIINNLKFASSKKEFMQSLFDSSGTCYGFFKAKKNGILFSDMQGKPFAFLVNNKHKEVFFVSCSERDGKIRYMFALCESDAKKFGMSDMGYIQKNEFAFKILEQYNDSMSI